MTSHVHVTPVTNVVRPSIHAEHLAWMRALHAPCLHCDLRAVDAGPLDWYPEVGESR